MTEALPVVYVLVLRNLAISSGESAALDPMTAQGRTRLLSKHLAWIHAVTEEMGRAGSYTVGIRTLPPPSRQVSGPPFSNSGQVVPMTAHGQDLRQFAQAFALALSALESEIDFSVKAPDKRAAWISRWIASAALTAHIQLTMAKNTPDWFAAVESPLGEDSASTEAMLSAFLSNCSPAVIHLLPQYKRCELKFAETWRNAMRQAIETIESPQAAKRATYEAEGFMANLLAYLTSNPPEEIEIKDWPRHRHERAELLLVACGICQDVEQAAQVLRRIRIGHSFEIRRELESAGANSPVQARFPTKGAEHAASHRGRLIFAKLWARLVAEDGLLNPRLVAANWPSVPAQNAINAEVFSVSSTRHSQIDASIERDLTACAADDISAPLTSIPEKPDFRASEK